MKLLCNKWRYRKLEREHFDVYISYHPAQLKQVEYHVNLMRNAKLKVWFDHGSDTEREFERNMHALKSSKMILCFQSDEYNRSLKNATELSVAVKFGLDIVKLVSSKKRIIQIFK